MSAQLIHVLKPALRNSKSKLVKNGLEMALEVNRQFKRKGKLGRVLFFSKLLKNRNGFAYVPEQSGLPVRCRAKVTLVPNPFTNINNVMAAARTKWQFVPPNCVDCLYFDHNCKLQCVTRVAFRFNILDEVQCAR